MPTGTVRMFKMPEGWGRIDCPARGILMLERVDLQTKDQLVDVGDEVEFEVAQTREGPKAVNVRLVRPRESHHG